MQEQLNQVLMSEESSTDFLCPHCGAGGFEVIDIERSFGKQEETHCVLILRCLTCHGRFRHLAQTLSSPLPDLDPTPAVAAHQS